MKNYNFKVYLGRTKGDSENVYLNGFSWDCDWYYGGGYIGNKKFHAHFDSAFLDVPDVRGHSLGNFCQVWENEKVKKGYTALKNSTSIWESLDFFLDDAQYTEKEWWRIKDVFKQFYLLRDAAEVFQYGGHCTNDKRNEKEINKPMARAINKHIQDIIIPEVIKALGLKKVAENTYSRKKPLKKKLYLF